MGCALQSDPARPPFYARLRLCARDGGDGGDGGGGGGPAFELRGADAAAGAVWRGACAWALAAAAPDGVDIVVTAWRPAAAAGGGGADAAAAGAAAICIDVLCARPVRGAVPPGMLPPAAIRICIPPSVAAAAAGATAVGAAVAAAGAGAVVVGYVRAVSPPLPAVMGEPCFLAELDVEAPTDDDAGVGDGAADAGAAAPSPTPSPPPCTAVLMFRGFALVGWRVALCAGGRVVVTALRCARVSCGGGGARRTLLLVATAPGTRVRPWARGDATARALFEALGRRAPRAAASSAPAAPAAAVASPVAGGADASLVSYTGTVSRVTEEFVELDGDTRTRLWLLQWPPPLRAPGGAGGARPLGAALPPGVRPGALVRIASAHCVALRGAGHAGFGACLRTSVEVLVAAPDASGMGECIPVSAAAAGVPGNGGGGGGGGGRAASLLLPRAMRVACLGVPAHAALWLVCAIASLRAQFGLGGVLRGVSRGVLLEHVAGAFNVAAAAAAVAPAGAAAAAAEHPRPPQRDFVAEFMDHDACCTAVVGSGGAAALCLPALKSVGSLTVLARRCAPEALACAFKDCALVAAALGPGGWVGDDTGRARVRVAEGGALPLDDGGSPAGAAGAGDGGGRGARALVIVLRALRASLDAEGLVLHVEARELAAVWVPREAPGSGGDGGARAARRSTEPPAPCAPHEGQGPGGSGGGGAVVEAPPPPAAAPAAAFLCDVAAAGSARASVRVLEVLSARVQWQCGRCHTPYAPEGDAAGAGGGDVARSCERGCRGPPEWSAEATLSVDDGTAQARAYAKGGAFAAFMAWGYGEVARWQRLARVYGGVTARRAPREAGARDIGGAAAGGGGAAAGGGGGMSVQQAFGAAVAAAVGRRFVVDLRHVPHGITVQPLREDRITVNGARVLTRKAPALALRVAAVRALAPAERAGELLRLLSPG